jgi:hypothetical protein
MEQLSQGDEKGNKDLLNEIHSHVVVFGFQALGAKFLV